MKPKPQRQWPAFLAAIATSVTGLSFAQSAPSSTPADSIAERTRPCTACHGKEGRATAEGYFPRIAGKPEGYLFNQLVNFRDGRRQNAAMIYLVQHMTDSYLHEIAHHFSSLDLPYPPPQLPSGSAEAIKRGETLVLHGDATKKIPSCVECHGVALTGVTPAMPGLLGLPRDYVVGQFGAWRSGQRKAAAPDCMAQITKQLTPDDIGAIANWLASRPLPFNPKPAASIALPLPLECGSGAKP